MQSRLTIAKTSWVLGGGAVASSAVAVYALASMPSEFPTSCENESPSWSNQQFLPRFCNLTRILTPLHQAAQLLPFDQEWSDMQPEQIPEKLEIIYGDLLKQGQAAAESDRLSEALAIVAGIPANSRHHVMAEKLQQDWSQELIQTAANHYQKAELDMALSILDAVPATSPLHLRATELKENWLQDATLLAQADLAKDSRDWEIVIDSLKSLEDKPLYHSLVVQDLLQQAIEQRFKPDTSMLKLAVVNAETEPSAVEPAPETKAPAPIANLSNTNAIAAPTDSVIDLEQALEWAKPPAPIASGKDLMLN